MILWIFASERKFRSARPNSIKLRSRLASTGSVFASSMIWLLASLRGMKRIDTIYCVYSMTLEDVDTTSTQRRQELIFLR
jgi:hypothetical protein